MGSLCRQKVPQRSPSSKEKRKPNHDVRSPQMRNRFANDASERHTVYLATHVVLIFFSSFRLLPVQDTLRKKSIYRWALVAIMSLCGINYPLEPYAWLPLAIASLMFIVPTLIPWRAIFLSVLVILMVISGSIAFEGFYLEDFSLAGHPDICAPPYMAAEERKIGTTSLWALSVAALFRFAFPDWRSRPDFIFRMKRLSKGYVIASFPTLILLLI